MEKHEKIQFIRTAIPSIKISHFEENNHGWDNDIFIINHQFVFRFPKTEQISQKIMKEKQILDLLIKKEPLLQLPQYKLFFDEQKKLICTCHEYIDGVPLNGNGDEIDWDGSAKLLGDFLTKLHRIQAVEYNKYSISTIHTFDYWNHFYSAVKQEIYPLLPLVYQSTIDQLFQRFFNQYTNNVHTKCIIHGDLTCSNILYSPNSKLVTGVIDFTDAQIGDPAFDFAGFYWDFGADFTKKVLSYYAGEEPAQAIFERVKSFYGLQPVFHELLHAVRNRMPINANEKMQKLILLQETGNDSYY